VTRLTLTFDNGPDESTTPAVLTALEQRSLPATFFVVGNQVRRSRELVERERAAGHHVGNHSMTHAVPLGEMGDPSAEVAEIVDAEAELGSALGPERLFRPFGGGGRIGPHLFSRAAVDALVDRTYTVALWTSVPRDWEDPTGWADRALADVRASDWTVLVLHDLPTGAMDHLPRFLDTVLADGVDVVAEFPDDCIPMRDGVVQWAFDHLIGGAATTRP
jgi:peptidoglycan/xylan/chitin deacetylase (PgdA/CDA1 family)